MKQIILSNGVVKTMTFEEVLKQFTPMINRATNIAMGKFTNNIEREDMIQEMKFEAWKAYEEYNGVNAFSTILHYKLMKVTGNEAQKITAQKRSSAGLVSMNATIGDGEDLTLQDMFAAEDFTSESMIAQDMMQLIKANLDERELEEFQCILYPEDFNASRLAEMRGISRQASAQRVNKTKAKIQQLLIAHNYSA